MVRKTRRSPALEKHLDKMTLGLFGRTRQDGECVACGAKVTDADFKNALSRIEYGISHLCQKCQDGVFEGA